jgi:hypothetical protein
MNPKLIMKMGTTSGRIRTTGSSIFSDSNSVKIESRPLSSRGFALAHRGALAKKHDGTVGYLAFH